VSFNKSESFLKIDKNRQVFLFPAVSDTLLAQSLQSFLDKSGKRKRLEGDSVRRVVSEGHRLKILGTLSCFIILKPIFFHVCHYMPGSGFFFLCDLLC